MAKMVEVSQERLAELEATEEAHGKDTDEINELITLVVDVSLGLERCWNGTLTKEEYCDLKNRMANVLGERE